MARKGGYARKEGGYQVKGDGPMTQITVDAERLARLRSLIDELSKFRNEQYVDGSSEPACGWPDYDEAVTDYSRDIAEAVQDLL